MPAAAMAEGRHISFNLLPAFNTDEIIYGCLALKPRLAGQAGRRVNNICKGAQKMPQHIHIITIKSIFVKTIDAAAVLDWQFRFTNVLTGVISNSKINLK